MKTNTPLNLVFSTARRLNYFQRNLFSLLKYNPDLPEYINRVYILDDRSSSEDREFMRTTVGNFFGFDRVHLVTFDDDSKWGFVKKLNFLRPLSVSGEHTLYLEDDWESVARLDLETHLFHLNELEADIITFTVDFSIQEENQRDGMLVDQLYWKNPWPGSFRVRTSQVSESGWINWEEVRYRHYSANPSLVKARVWHQNEFYPAPNYEAKFADSSNLIQYFTISPKFIHIGEVSLEKSLIQGT